MDPKALSWILETKSDQIYTNEKFQRETFRKYTEMLNIIYKTSKDMNDEVIIEQLLEIVAYILNSVHYYQKFKLKCDLLHPLDVLLVIEKVKKEKRSKENGQPDDTFERQISNIENSMKALTDPVGP